MSEEVSKRLFSVKEAGRYLGRSPWSIRNLIWKGHLPQVRQGRKVMVDRVDMDHYIAKHKMEVKNGDDLPPEEA